MGEAAGGICSGMVVGGRYRLLSIIGRGGMAEVWRGHDQRLGREVAVKVIDSKQDPEARERFDREARTAAALSHPAIVGLHDAGSDDGVDYLVMELVHGETLSHRIKRGPMPADEIADLAAQLCDALSAAHSAGIVHRDIKPGNILVTQAGQVKVCDFGIACHDSEAVDADSDTTVGTAQYMAPEQARGGPATPRTDLYGLGCVMYAMATGHPPFTAKTSARVAWQHLNETPVAVASRRPGAPSWLDSVVMSLLAKEPADRPASAAEVRESLPSPAKRAPSKPAPERHHGKSKTMITGEPTVQLKPAGAIMPGRLRLAAMGVLAFATMAAVVLVLSAVSAKDMPSAQLTLPPAEAQAQEQVQVQTSPSPLAPPPVQAHMRPVSDPVNALDALRAALDEQERAGNVKGKSLRELNGKLDEIERELAHGEGEKASKKLEEFARKLGDLRRKGEITATTLTSLETVLGDLSEQLRDGADD